MNIEGSNLLSMLSGAEAQVASTPGSLLASGENTGFSAALMEQLSALQAGLGKAMDQGSALQNAELGKLPADAQAAMQSFAALFGKNLPPAGKVEPNIDLDDTMKALADVMQHLQSLQPQPVAVVPTAETLIVPATETAAVEVAILPKPLAGAEHDSKQDPVDVGLPMSEQPPIVPQAQIQTPLPTQDNVEPQAQALVVGQPLVATTEDEVAGQTEVRPLEDKPASTDEPTIAEQALAAGSVPLAVAIAQAQAQAQAAAAAALPVATNEVVAPQVSMPSARKSPSVQQSVVKDMQILPQAASEQSEDFGLEFKRRIDAMLPLANTVSEQAAKEQGGLPKDEKLWLPLDNSVSGATTQNTAESADKRGIDFGGELSRLSQALPANTSAAKTAAPSIATPMGKPAWNEDLGQKLIWMTKQSMPSAELRLNPEHLGPVLVKIEVHQDQTSVSFTAQHQVVRDAIEAAIPKLREMFSGQQLQLADVNVSQHQQQSEQRQARDFFQAASEQGRRGQGSDDDNADPGILQSQDIADEIEAGRAIAGNGLLSLFA